MKYIIGLILISTISITGFAQVLEELTFDELVHDFGQVKELDGSASHEFVFTNTSSDTIKIMKVKASCGCTTPAWTKVGVAPGEKGFIKAVYSTRNRPGPFNKTLTVTSNTQKQTHILRIRGQVEPKPRTIEDDFPTVMGAMRIKYSTLQMGRIYNNKPVTKTFPIYNEAENSIRFMPEVEKPDYITVVVEPQVLESKQRGVIKLTYDPVAKNNLGYMQDNFVLKTDEEGGAAIKSLGVNVNINEYFKPLTPQEQAQAPVLKLMTNLVDLGKLKQGDNKKATFVLKNVGKSPLNIRKAVASCGCLTYEINKYDLEPGESADIILTFDSYGRRGNQQKSVTIYSNDPKRPVQMVTVKASVAIASAPAN